jgi:hypothetical protein
MATTLRMTFWFWLGALAFWLVAGLSFALWQGFGLVAMVIPLALSGMSALMFAEGAVTWSFARTQFVVGGRAVWMALAFGAASCAATLAVGVLLNVFWALLLTRVSILPALILTTLVWYVGTVACCAWLYHRFSPANPSHE